MTDIAYKIKYEKQQDNFSCGAAALSMVYRALGVEQAQAKIWERVRCQDERGQWGSRCHQLANDALKQGVSAILLQAGDPWATLQHCVRQELQVILYHRLQPGARQWHHAVLIGVEGEVAIIHDPYFGPSLRRSRSELLELWKPPAAGGERGHELIAFAHWQPGSHPNCRCGKAVPAAQKCGGCEKLAPLTLLAALGCANPACRASVWKTLYCPHCNAPLQQLDGAAAGSGRASASSADGKPPAAPASGGGNPAAEAKQAAGPGNDAPAKSSPLGSLMAFPEKFAPFMAFAAKLHEAAPESKARTQFGLVLDHLKQNIAGFTDALGKMGARQQKREEATARRVGKIKEGVAKKQAATEAALARKAEKAAKAAAAAVPALPLPAAAPAEEAKLGAELRDSLLKEYGLLSTSPAVREFHDEGSIAQMGSSAWSEAPATQPAAAPLPRPVPQKAAPLPRPQPADKTAQPPPARKSPSKQPASDKEIGDDDLSDMFGSTGP